MDRSIIDQYEAGPAKLKSAIAGLTAEQLQTAPIPGKWSLQQLVVHLTDSDLVMTERMKRIIAEENPKLQSFDENLWIANLGYERQPAAESVELFGLNRMIFGRVLRQLPDAAFERAGVHNERGRQTLADIVRFTVQHLDHHLKFANEKRARLLGAA